MPAASFFPWLAISEPIKVGRYRLVPYQRGLKPGPKDDPVQKDLDSVLAHYFTNQRAPVDRATLLIVGRRKPTRDLTARDIEDAFTFAELLAFSALSAREFFGLGIVDYVNRDLYRLIVQRFEGHGGVAITTRRRDGNTNAFISSDAYRVFKPEHVHVPLHPVIDLKLLGGLVEARARLQHQEWEGLFGGISAFNLSNTDSNEVRENVEAILLSASLEQILSASSNADDIARKFGSALKPTSSMLPSAKVAIERAQGGGRFKKANSLREGWVRDFYALRGHVAHRSHSGNYPSIWTLKEHLLLVSFAIPLLVKQRLSTAGFYSLSRDDRIKVDVFEALCVRDFLKKPRQGKEWPWREVLGEAMMDEWFRQSAKAG